MPNYIPESSQSIALACFLIGLLVLAALAFVIALKGIWAGEFRGFFIEEVEEPEGSEAGECFQGFCEFQAERQAARAERECRRRTRAEERMRRCA